MGESQPRANAAAESLAQRHRRGLRLSVLRGALLILGALGYLAFFHSGRLPVDLHVYVLGGRAALHGHDIYGPTVAIGDYPFTYPPFAALPLALLSVLPSLLILAVSCAVFYACLIFILRVCSPGLMHRAVTTWSGWFTVVAILAFNPVWATIKDGQVNMILAALVLGDLLGMRRGRGVLVGVAAAIKLTPAVFVLYLLATRQWTAARNAVFGFLGCAGLAWVLLPADSRRYWFHELYKTGRIGQVDRVSNQSLLGLASKQLSGARASHIVWAFVAIATAIVALKTCQRLHATGQEVLALGVVGVLGCLLSPITWTHHWVWVVPLLLGFIASPAWHSPLYRGGAVVVALIFIRGASEKPPDIPVLHMILSNLYTIAGLVALVAIAWAAQLGRQQTAEPGGLG